MDSIFGALADNRRRLILQHLQKHYTVTLPDLAELVAEQEQGKDVSVISGDRVTDVYASLYHTHVPTLAEADLVCYEQEDDLVAQTECSSTALTSAIEEIKELQTA